MNRFERRETVLLNKRNWKDGAAKLAVHSINDENLKPFYGNSSKKLTIYVCENYALSDGSSARVAVAADERGLPFLTSHPEITPVPWTYDLYKEVKDFDPEAATTYGFFFCPYVCLDVEDTMFRLLPLIPDNEEPITYFLQKIEELDMLPAFQPDKRQEVLLESSMAIAESGKGVEAPDDGVIGGDVMGDLRRLQSKKYKRDDKPHSFMNREGKYTMREYASLIRKNCSAREWELLKKFTSMDEETTNFLGDLNTRFNLMSVLLELNKSFTTEYATILEKGHDIGAKSVSELATMDHVGSRYAQAAGNDELFFPALNHVREGELIPFVNVFDQNRKLYYSASPKFPVAHSVTLTRGTKDFAEYVKTISADYDNLIPRTPFLMGDYTDDDYSVLSDVTVSQKKGEEGKIRMIWSTKGGSMFSDKEELTTYHKVGPFGRMMGEGVPSIFKLFYAYQYDVAFAKSWDDSVKIAAKQRHSNRDLSIYTNWLTSSKDFFDTWTISRKTGLGMIDSFYESSTEDDYAALVDVLHEYNRDLISTISVDRSAFMKLIYQTSYFSSELLPIAMMNDLLFEGHDVHLRYAHDLVSSVHLLTTDQNARPACHPKDKITFDNRGNDKFDVKRNGVESIIDLTDAVQSFILIGGGTFKDKTTLRDGDGRAKLYYHYEPGESYSVAGQTKYVRVPTMNDKQYRHADLVLSALKNPISTVQQVGVITSIRSLPLIIKDYNVVMIAPAPFPMTMCAYVVAVRHKGQRRIVNLDNARDLVMMLNRKIRLINEIYMHGSADLRADLDRQMDLESSEEMGPIFSMWWELLKQRYASEDGMHVRRGSSNKRIKMSLERMLRMNQQVVLKSKIKSAGARMDSDLNRFKLKKKTLA